MRAEVRKVIFCRLLLLKARVNNFQVYLCTENRRRFSLAFKYRVVQEWDANKATMNMKAFAFRNSRFNVIACEIS